MKGKIIAVCRGKEKGKPKEDVGSGFFEEGVGLIGDAHAGTKKQVSILAQEKVQELSRQTGLFFPPGAFAENLLIAGIDSKLLTPGKTLKIGRVLLKVEMIGKEPNLRHSYNYKGYSLLPRYGIFARVIQNGIIRNGDQIELLNHSP
ncbi:MAG: MOSC domain-containing protein [Thermodesulfobacteriota bacterium]